MIHKLKNQVLSFKKIQMEEKKPLERKRSFLSKYFEKNTT